MMRRTANGLSLLARTRGFSLSDLGWTLRNQNGSTVRISGSLPSQAHIDLLKAGIINDPLLGINGEVRGHSR